MNWNQAGGLLAFDPDKLETAFMTKDRYKVGEKIAADIRKDPQDSPIAKDCRKSSLN